MELVADRFIVNGEGRAVDLASGESVTLIVSTLGSPSEQLRWAERCAWFSRLCHPTIAPLIDYGALGTTRRFEAWRCGPRWSGARGAAERVVRMVSAFLQACDLTAGAAPVGAIRLSKGRVVVLPGPDAGFEWAGRRLTSATTLPLGACGVSIAGGSAVAALCEMFAHASCRWPRVVSLLEPPGVGVERAVDELARAARAAGFVPLAPPFIHHPVLALLEGRSVFLIAHIPAARGWRGLLECALQSPRSHLLLFIGPEGVSQVPGIRLERLSAEALVRSVWPRTLDHAALRRVERAARQCGGRVDRFTASLWGGPTSGHVWRRADRAPRVAEQPATYGDNMATSPNPVTMTHRAAWSIPGQLVTFRRRMEAARGQLERGRSAPGERGLRVAVASLARRRDWPHALDGALGARIVALEAGPSW